MQKKKREIKPPSASLRRLPAVSRLLADRSLARLVREHGPRLVTALLRQHLDGLRVEILGGTLPEPELARATRPATIARSVGRSARELLAPRPRPVINATGVIVHTNLGRSILSEAAADRVAVAARGYLDLEYEIPTGKRGSRLSHLEPLMRHLFPGWSFTVVNNNAAAVMLCLRALSHRKEALISRGELVEIGGSFRIPDIMAASGAKLREVGTTNRTRASDYESALGPRTGIVLKVHTSNFRIVGFTEAPTVGDLSRVATKAGVPLVVDWGSGDLVDLGSLGIHDEMPARRVLEEGADLVTFSGDKLLGGPQVGFVVGRADLIARLRRDPFSRVCRLDRLLVAALHQTLTAYVRGTAMDEIPTLRMLAASPTQIGRRASKLRRELAKRTGAGRLLSIIDGVSRTGGGSSPAGERPTRLLAIEGPSGDATSLERRLRAGEPPIVARLQDRTLLIDLRTVLADQQPVVTDRLSEALGAEIEAAAAGAPRRSSAKGQTLKRK